MTSEAQGDGGCAAVHVFHTRPTSGALYEPVSQRLLPLDAQWQKDLASRLAAMQRAEKNIDSLLTDLNRTFYRLRQSSIHEELFDVIAGFNALSQKAPGSGR